MPSRALTGAPNASSTRTASVWPAHRGAVERRHAVLVLASADRSRTRASSRARPRCRSRPGDGASGGGPGRSSSTQGWPRRKHRLGGLAVATRAGGDEAVEGRQFVVRAVREQPRRRCRGCRAVRPACAASLRRPGAARDRRRARPVARPSRRPTAGPRRAGAPRPPRPRRDSDPRRVRAARSARPDSSSTASCRRVAARRRMPSTLSAETVQQLERVEVAPPPAMCIDTPSVGSAPASSSTSASGRCRTAQIAAQSAVRGSSGCQFQ